jgi:hypothetical protein
VRFAVWVSTIDSVSKLVLDCRFHGRKPVVWTGRYAEERSYALELEPPRRSRITEPAKSA